MEDQSLVTFAVKVTPEAFVKRRLVSGPIWLEMEGDSFPGREWDDFPVVILGFWLTNIQPLILGQSKMCVCPFMDGPYQFDLHVESNGSWEVTFIEREVNDEKRLGAATVNCEFLIAQLLSAAEIVVDVCRREQWIDDDLVNLESLIFETKKK